MAVENTGAMYKAFTFDGESSRNYGVYITGEAVYNAPERDIEMVSIPGRNGSYALDRGRFQNIEVTYPAGIYADTESDFADAISDLRNMLCSRTGYCRLVDEYNPNEYRLAIYKGGLEVTPTACKAGEFEITFECMPQRFLTSGETKQTITSGDTITNPTLFDAEPMLEVYGYGTINIGSKTVTLYDQPVGDIVVAEQAKNSFSTSTVEIDDTYANLGDEITFERIFVQTDSRAPNNQYIYTPNITASGTGVTVSADVEVNGRQLLTTITLDSDSSLVFAYGTSKSVSAVANSSFTVHGSTVTSTTTIGLSYDGNKTFTLSRSVTFSQAGYALMMNNTFNLLGPTHLNSTQNLLGNPTYIDLSIGEAYRIDGDSAASLNNAVVLPIELPTLPKGGTEITFDNTVTRLDIVPRWWKI